MPNKQTVGAYIDGTFRVETPNGTLTSPYPAALLRGPFVFAPSSAGYTGIWTNGAELSNREILRTLNEQGEKVTAQEGEIAQLRADLDDAHQHVGALLKMLPPTSINKDRNAALLAARAWLRRGAK